MWPNASSASCRSRSNGAITHIQQFRHLHLEGLRDELHCEYQLEISALSNSASGSSPPSPPKSWSRCGLLSTRVTLRYSSSLPFVSLTVTTFGSSSPRASTRTFKALASLVRVDGEGVLTPVSICAR